MDRQRTVAGLDVHKSLPSDRSDQSDKSDISGK